MPLRLFIFALALFASASCKNKSTQQSICKTNPGSCKSILEAKRFFLFKEGSWWVYEEETSHVRDSVYVYEYYDSGGYDFDMRVRSALTGAMYHYWPLYVGGSRCSEHALIQARCLFVNRSKGFPGNHIGESQCFFLNYKVGDFETTGSDVTLCLNNKIYIQQIVKDYLLNGFVFDEVVKIHELCTYIEGSQPTNHYYVKDIGIVRKEFIDSNQTWNLVEYHIAP